MDLAERTRVEDFAGAERFDANFVGRQKYRLEATRTTLLRELDGSDGGLGSLDGQDDPAFRALALEFETVLRRRLGRRLRHTERALEKIREGTYGLCDVTGEPIPAERLDLVPETVFAARTRRTAGLL